MKRRLATMAAAEIPPRMARVPSTLPNLPRRLAFLTAFVDEGARSETTTKDGATKAPEESKKDEESKVTSYVGENPPEGYVIKGNDRSMKYHVPGSGGYDRTIADVWFATEEAAQAAGFTKAQR